MGNTGFQLGFSVVHKNHSFKSIQALRFFAAAAVVCYHAQLTAVSYFGGNLPYRLLDMGVYGVDLFFVISGFIVVFIGSTRETSASVFVRRRIQRIVPLYWIMTGVMFALTHIPGLARSEVSGLDHLIQSIFFVSWTNGSGTYPVLNVGWTLEIEMFYYLVISVAMIFGYWRWMIAAFVILFLVLTGREPASFFQQPIMIEFVFGMIIGTFLYDRRSFPWLLAGTMPVLLTLPVDGAAWRVWVLGLPSAALVTVAIFADLRKVHAGRILSELGNASYSIYLVHVIAISFVCKIALVFTPRLPTAVIIPVASVFAIAIGYITYLLIEKKLLRLFKGRHRAIRNCV